MHRYTYDETAEQLFIKYPSVLHEGCVIHFQLAIQALLNDWKASKGYWAIGLNSKFHVHPSTRKRKRNPSGEFMPDLTLMVLRNKRVRIPKIVVEVAHTQTQRDAQDKISWYMEGKPDIDLAILVKLYEGSWTAPPPASHQEELIDEISWDANIPLTGEGYGPVRVRGVDWTAPIKCTVTLFDREPNSPQVRVSTPHVSVILVSVSPTVAV